MLPFRVEIVATAIGKLINFDWAISKWKWSPKPSGWRRLNKSKVVIMMSEGDKGRPVCPSLAHWEGVSRTALLEGFRLQGQIQLLQLLHVFQHQGKVEVKSLLYSVFMNLILESGHKTCNKSVSADWRAKTTQTARQSVKTEFPLFETICWSESSPLTGSSRIP